MLLTLGNNEDIQADVPNAGTVMISLNINSSEFAFSGDSDTPLLWVLRDHLNLTGTKYGCGIGQCGACTVHIDGVAQRSCLMPVSGVGAKKITTIEGLAAVGEQTGELKLHPVQQAWVELDVPQCGYCQAGQIMATVDLLARIPSPSDEDINREISNICRCGTYVRLRKAIHRAAELSAGES
ncbi:MAG: isoquinoline 1-oxidoreductase alpha subunit [Lysobacterales bacterium]|jgi:isoquinoline 1-oxidoreductase alpha subunit